MSVSTPTIDDIHSGLDSYFSFLSNEWSSPLEMPMHVGFGCQYGSAIVVTDVNHFIGNKERSAHLGDYAYFSREKVPVPTPIIDKKTAYDAFQPLYHDLICAARISGFELVQKGRVPDLQLRMCKNSLGTNIPFDAWDLICGRYYTYGSRLGKRARKDDGTEVSDIATIGSLDYGEYRKTNLHGDRWNTQGTNGKSMPQKRSTNKALSKSDCCRYGIRIYLDDYGFFIRRNGKPHVHCGHMRRMPNDIPAKLRYLSESNKEEIS